MEQDVITKKAVRQVLTDYWRQYRNYPWQSLVAFFLPALGTIFVYFVPPLLVGKIINTFVSQHQISLSAVAVYIALFGGLWLLGEVFWRVGFHYLIKLEAEGINTLSKNAFQQLTGRDYEFFVNNFVGALTKKALAYSKNFESFTDTLIFRVTTNVLPLMFVVVVLWRYSPWIPIILVAFLAMVIFVALPIIKRRSKLVALRHDASSRMVARLSDSMTNMLAVKAFAKEKPECDVYGKYSQDFADKFKKAGHYHTWRLDTTLSPIYVAANVVGLIVAIYFAKKLELQAGTIVVVFSYYSQITKIFWEVNQTYRTIESSLNESAEFTEMFINPPRIQDSPLAKPLRVKNASIRFDRVDFKYPDVKDEEESFLEKFSLEIKNKEKVGLVGPSGGGKTTITKLILRFADANSGVISINGQDISKVTQTSLREAISYVPQEPLLFHRSLFENIAYGNENASEKEVIKAAKLAHADEFISKLPLGYQTLVGERGIKLSGGQRQRIAIARALLKKSSILVLDEATSSLDSESEKYIQEGLWELMKDKTALVIAHRLSTIKHLDRILVLDDGEIVQDGTHEELVRQKGMYAKLWGHQAGEKREEPEAVVIGESK